MPGFELIGAEERAAINSVFDSGGGILFRYGFDAARNNSFKVRAFEEAFAKRMGCAHALGVSSGSTALRVALAALAIQPGDEVITQAFTFVATAEAIVEAGGIPVIADIDETLNMCPRSLESLITPKTRAVIAVHMFGTPARLDGILEVTRKSKIPLIEDTAWGCGASLHGRHLGTIGDIGTFSFDYAKTITTGEGGMVVTNNPDLDFRARAFHDHGHENNPDLPRWEDSRHAGGFNYRMMELQGALGLAQLGKLDTILAAQRRNFQDLSARLADIRGVTLRAAPAGAAPSYDALVFSVASPEQALRCRKSLLEHGVGTKVLPEAITWHFAQTWTHIPQLMGRARGLGKGWLESSRKILASCVAVPLNLKPVEGFNERVYEGVRKALSQA